MRLYRRPGAVDNEYCDQFDCEGDATTAPQGIACVERPPSLETTNLRYPYRVDDSAEHALLGLLCVEKNNSAVTGNYLIDQGYPNAAFDGDAGFHTTSQQKFEAAFVPHDELDNDAPKRPGYVQGDAVAAAGASPPESGELERVEGGLRVMNFGKGGDCSSASSQETTVGFAKNLRVGCVHRMTRNELRNLCTSAGSHSLLATVAGGDSEFVHPRVLDYEQQDWLGIFANAERDDRRQWVKIEPGDDGVARKRLQEVEFLDNESRCVGIPTRLSYEILWTHVGSVDSPHAKILGARRTWSQEHRLQHVLPPGEEQPYTFDTTVSWTYRKPEPELVVKPPPAHIFSVPYDIFYPFVGAPDDEEF